MHPNYFRQFFANKAIQEADRIWEQQNLSNQDMEKWLNE